ncbi:hypothetical protein WMF30_46715 [Sorangium sp. So ce134]
MGDELDLGLSDPGKPASLPFVRDGQRGRGAALRIPAQQRLTGRGGASEGWPDAETWG